MKREQEERGKKERRVGGWGEERRALPPIFRYIFNHFIFL